MLLGQESGTYKIAYRNDNAVGCIDCRCLYEFPFTGTSIENGHFILEYLEPEIAGEFGQFLTFQYDKSKKNWFLKKDHYISSKLHLINDNGKEIKQPVKDLEEIKTPIDFGQVTFDNFNIYSEKGY